MRSNRARVMPGYGEDFCRSADREWRGCGSFAAGRRATMRSASGPAPAPIPAETNRSCSRSGGREVEIDLAGLRPRATRAHRHAVEGRSCWPSVDARLLRGAVVEYSDRDRLNHPAASRHCPRASHPGASPDRVDAHLCGRGRNSRRGR